MIEFHDKVFRRLRRAGWYEGRNVWSQLHLPKKFHAFPEAERVLSEFGNLEFRNASGIMRFDPSVGDDIAEEIQEYQKKVGQEFYPLGIVDGGDTAYILIDPAGGVYALAGRLEPLASSFKQAVKYLSKVYSVNEREQKTDLLSVGMFGKFWTL